MSDVFYLIQVNVVFLQLLYTKVAQLSESTHLQNLEMQYPSNLHLRASVLRGLII